MSLLHAAFDSEKFRADAHRVVDLLANILCKELRAEGSVLPWSAPAEQLEYWAQRMDGPREEIADFLAAFAERSIKIHHPHYMGHQVCAPLPAAALAGFAAELLNNGMAVYEMGPASTALERWLVRRVCVALGFAEGDGFLTSGGTLATLTALLAARGRMLGPDALSKGTDAKFAVIASEEAHYCTARAVQVMGWGEEGLIAVPVDARFKLRVDLLKDALFEAARRGRRVIAVVASACSTSTGSYDDIHALADFCTAHGLWLHVDGAHGAAVAFCPELKHLLSGIERADSAILDFHKLLLTPALGTAVVFREASSSWAAFHQRAQYLFAENNMEPWCDGGRRTMECTKLGMSVRIAAIWKTQGEAFIAEHLRTVHALAKEFVGKIRSRSAFEVATEPESNIVCFRIRPPGTADGALDDLNSRLRRRIIEEGAFYIVQTKLRGRVWLRTALMNPLSSGAHLESLLDALEAIASSL
jgi:L-2,4-diaminobutyrate decarboxylase